MTGKELREWAATLPDDCEVQVNLGEMAKENDWHRYREYSEWVELSFDYLQATWIHIPAQRRAKMIGTRVMKGDE